MDEHQYLEYQEDRNANNQVARMLATYIFNKVLNKNLSTTNYLRSKGLAITSGGISTGINYSRMVHMIRETRDADLSKNKISLGCNWLEMDMGISTNSSGISLQLQLPYGDSFPLRPKIDRECAAFGSFQGAVGENILKQHHYLVSNSHLSVSMSHDWINSLRILISECISYIEILLHQIYFCAMYQVKSGLFFDVEKLGDRHGRRFMDKIEWVKHISGKPLDDARDELAAINVFRKMRNHFSHFDPPCVAYTVEEVATWLNLVPLVGRLALKIRKRIDAQISREIVRLIMLRPVVFKQRIDGRVRPSSVAASYQSCVWPCED